MFQKSAIVLVMLAVLGLGFTQFKAQAATCNELCRQENHAALQRCSYLPYRMKVECIDEAMENYIVCIEACRAL